MGLVDVVVAAAVLACAGWLLYRSLVKGGGACGACSQRGACHAPRREVVTLGFGRRAPPTQQAVGARGAHPP
jgi:hypothetical protein